MPMEACRTGAPRTFVLPQAQASPWPLKTLTFSSIPIPHRPEPLPPLAAHQTGAHEALSSPDLKFGMEPLTLAWLTMTAGSYFVQRGLGFVLDDIQVKTSQLELSASKSFQKARQRLEIANSCGIRDKTEYIRKAETHFSEAASDFQMAYLQAECYKYAALCAKMGRREDPTIRKYAQMAQKRYHAGGPELLQLYDDSRDPIKNLGVSTRALLSETLWVPLRILGHLSGNACLIDLSTRVALGRQNAALRQKTAVLLQQYGRSDLPTVCRQLGETQTGSNPSGLPRT